MLYFTTNSGISLWESDSDIESAMFGTISVFSKRHTSVSQVLRTIAKWFDRPNAEMYLWRTHGANLPGFKVSRRKIIKNFEANESDYDEYVVQARDLISKCYRISLPLGEEDIEKLSDYRRSLAFILPSGQMNLNRVEKLMDHLPAASAAELVEVALADLGCEIVLRLYEDNETHSCLQMFVRSGGLLPITEYLMKLDIEKVNAWEANQYISL